MSADSVSRVSQSSPAGGNQAPGNSATQSRTDAVPQPAQENFQKGITSSIQGALSNESPAGKSLSGKITPYIDTVKNTFDKSDAAAKKLSTPEGKAEAEKMTPAESQKASEANLANAQKLQKTVKAMSDAELLKNRDAIKEPIDKAGKDEEKINSAMKEAIGDPKVGTPEEQKAKQTALDNNEAAFAAAEAARLDAYTRIIAERRRTGVPAAG
jgi:hypothetical protein